MYDCPLFNTHHAPVGAWASLTFGAPDVGISFDLQNPSVKKAAYWWQAVLRNGTAQHRLYADAQKRRAGVGGIAA